MISDMYEMMETTSIPKMQFEYKLPDRPLQALAITTENETDVGKKSLMPFSVLQVCFK